MSTSNVSRRTFAGAPFPYGAIALAAAKPAARPFCLVTNKQNATSVNTASPAPASTNVSPAHESTNGFRKHELLR